MKNRTGLDFLLSDGQDWARLKATIVVGRTAADLALGEAELRRECSRAGLSLEVMASTDNLRVYRIGGAQ